MTNTLLHFGRDDQGYNAFAPPPSNLKYSSTLTVGIDTSITVPSSAKTWTVVFSLEGGSSIWVDFSGATAAVPAGNTLQATTSELNPASRTVNAGTVVSMITGDATANVSVMLYANI